MKKTILLLSLLFVCLASFAVPCYRNIAIRNTTGCTVYCSIYMNNGTCGSGVIESYTITIAPGTTYYWGLCPGYPVLNWYGGSPTANARFELIKIQTNPANLSCPPLGTLTIGESICGLASGGSVNTQGSSGGCPYAACTTISANWSTTQSPPPYSNIFSTVVNIY